MQFFVGRLDFLVGRLLLLDCGLMAFFQVRQIMLQLLDASQLCRLGSPATLWLGRRAGDVLKTHEQQLVTIRTGQWPDAEADG